MKRFKLAGVLVRWPILLPGILALAAVLDLTMKSNQRAESAGSNTWILMSAYAADAVMIDRSARDFKLPEQVEWKGRPGSLTQTAFVYGDPSKPGLYVQLLKRGPNDWSQPHSHPDDRFITVLAGSMRIGTGTKLDRENTVELRPGSFVKDIANRMHYDGTGPDGLTIQIVGMGPTTAPPSEAK